MWERNDKHAGEACEQLLARFLIDPAQMPAEACELAGAMRRTAPYVVGLALWDVFSANHTVIDASGVAYDLGSWRASAGFLADCIDRKYTSLGPHDYLDFYMGSMLGLMILIRLRSMSGSLPASRMPDAIGSTRFRAFTSLTSANWTRMSRPCATRVKRSHPNWNGHAALRR